MNCELFNSMILFHYLSEYYTRGNLRRQAKKAP